MKMVSLDELSKALDLKTLPTVWRECWVDSESSYPSECLYFVQEDYLTDINNDLKLSDDKMELLMKTAALIRNSEFLCHYTWLWYYLTFMTDKVNWSWTFSEGWPLPEKDLGQLKEMLHALVLLGEIPTLREFYEKKGINREVYLDTLAELSNCMGLHKKFFGFYGIGVYRMGWLILCFKGRIFRIDRLHFMHCYFGIDADGGSEDGGHNIYENAVTGKRISCKGNTDEPMVLQKQGQWKLLLQKGDGLLDVHIPVGDTLNHDECIMSYKNAINFFRRFFPEQDVKGFFCGSWLLCPELTHLLKKESNILKFQNDYFIYDTFPENNSAIYDFVFWKKPSPLEELPGDTSLQRGIKEYLAAGKSIYAANGVIMENDIA